MGLDTHNNICTYLSLDGTGFDFTARNGVWKNALFSVCGDCCFLRRRLIEENVLLILSLNVISSSSLKVSRFCIDADKVSVCTGFKDMMFVFNV